MRRLRALLAFAAAASVLLLAGCGGGHGKSSSPLDAAVGYFSKDAPFVAAVETDPDGPQIKQLTALIGRIPGSEVLAVRLQNLTRFRFADWGRDIRPQLGAPLVVGLAKPVAGKDLPVALVVALRVKHPLRAKQVLLRQPGFRGHGKASGVRIYENTNESRYAAVDGDVLVAATNRDILEHALAMKRSDNRMRASDFNRDVADLPSGGLLRVSADPRQMLGADPRLRPGLTVKWIAALRRMGAVVKATATGVTLDLKLASDAAGISDADLPLSPQSAAIPLIGGKNELQLGLRAPARLARLAFAFWHAIAPARAKALDLLEPKGVDLERQVPHHLSGTAALAVDPVSKEFAFRAGLIDSADARDALARLAPHLPDLAALLGVKGVGVASPAAGESFYALAKPNAKTVVFGVVGNSLVAASRAKRAGELASEPTHLLPAIKGAAVMTLNARDLVTTVLARQLGGAAGLFAPFIASSLRDLSGALTIDRSALRGHFKLTIVR